VQDVLLVLAKSGVPFSALAPLFRVGAVATDREGCPNVHSKAESTPSPKIVPINRYDFRICILLRQPAAGLSLDQTAQARG
jgi:hypothetical protein